MSIPALDQRGGIFTLTWLPEKLVATISRISQQKDRVPCEVTFTTTAPGYSPHIWHTNPNLIAGTTFGRIAKTLAKKYPRITEDEADAIIEQLSVLVLKAYRQGEEAIELSSETDIDITKQEYKIEPLIIAGAPNLFFGDGGVGKSTLGVLFAVMIQLPWEENPLGMKVTHGRVLYLDWEGDKLGIAKRLKSIIRGAGMEFGLDFTYRRCFMPLMDDIEAIQKLVLERNIDTVIIDSLGYACNRDLAVPETATSIHNCIRSLNVTSIIFHHISKDKRVKKETPFGSVYFRNSCRMAWNVKKSQEKDSPVMDIMLKHDKGNDVMNLPAVGIRITFDEGKRIISKAKISEMPEFAAEASIPNQIRDLLTEGAKSITEISQRIGKNDAYARAVLSRMKLDGQVVKIGRSEWGLSI